MSESYGDVVGEYTALRTSAAYVPQTHRLLVVEGPEAISFLDGQLSQDVAGLAVGGVGRSLILEPRGKLVAIAWVLRGEAWVGLIVDASAAEAAVDQLKRFFFRVDATLGLDPTPVGSLIGPRSTDVLPTVDPGEAEWVLGPPIVASAPLGGLRRLFVVGEVPDARPAGRLAYDAVRIEAGEPVVGVDVNDTTIPQEAGIVADTVSFTKGCYLGQELVARIDSRGRVNRHLRGIVLETNIVPPVGAAVVANGEEVGTISSVAESLTVMAPVAMGLVRREVAPGDPVIVRWEGGQAPARLEELPLDTFTVA